MSAVTLTNDQLLEAARVLYNRGQFDEHGIVCDDDDIHEYLVEEGLLKQDPDADTDRHPDAFQWLSDESLERLRAVRVLPYFTFTEEAVP